MAALKTGDVVICGCGCNSPMIITEIDEARGMLSCWMKDNGRWMEYGLQNDFGTPTPHPDPDALYAEFAAAQLLGQVDDRTV